jgi:uncharacterized membrane protein
MDFSAGSALKFGWERFRRYPWFFVGSTVVLLIASAAGAAIIKATDYTLTGSVYTHTGVGRLVEFVLASLIHMGNAAFYLSAHDDPERTTLAALWHPSPLWKYLLASLLLSILVLLGLILFIVPGIIFLMMFWFTLLIVVDREFGPIEAMKESKRITYGHKWELLGLVLWGSLVLLLGVLAFGVGLLVAIPVVSLAFVHAYRVLGLRTAADAALTPAAG